MTQNHLKPANQNPWYILMTLHGEQTGDEIDPDLHRRNSTAWNKLIGSHFDPILKQELEDAGVGIVSSGSIAHSDTVRSL